MIKKINDFLAGLPVTLVGGCLLILSFTLNKMHRYWLIDPAWITVFLCGLPLLYLSLWRLIHNRGINKISSALLITVAMFAAIGIGDLFAAGEVAFIMEIGAILEELTTKRAKKGLKKLLTLAPTQGRCIRGKEIVVIPADQIQPNDILRILPGETIPVDGIIITGETSIDQSIMTGESLPIDKTINDPVFCGSLNCFGSIDIRATQVGKDSSLQKLIQMVQEAENKKAPMARIADRYASYLVPIAVLIAMITGLITRDITRAVTILVVFCPCALVLATPTAIMAAIGQATKHGVIIKSGDALEKMGKVNAIAFDKTGTLTYGHLKVSDLLSFSSDFDAQALLQLSASVEAKSEHPLAQAIVEKARDEHLTLLETQDFKISSGKGVSATLNNLDLLCGNEAFIKAHHLQIPTDLSDALHKFRLQGKATILIGINKVCVGLIALSDIIREDSKTIISKLHQLHTNTALLTGDNQLTANYLAQQVDITQVYADLLPIHKLKQISSLQNQGYTVCMVGDGINDAPALKTADVGIAMGGIGSDIAIDSADIVLMRDNISKLPYLKRLAKATVNTIKLSITLSMCINFVAIILSILGILTPTTGALVHNAGSCFVVLIAALLYDRKFE